VDLGRGVRLDRLSPDERDLVMHACAPRGHYFVPVRPPAQRYSLIRDVDPKEADQRLEWDPDSVLRDALMLARLVRDNNHSTEYAARVTNYDDGQQMVMPSPLPATQVYRLRQDRDWLDDAEADQLRDLLASYWAVQDDLPRRVRAATLRVEYAGWSPWADAMLPTLVGGLEALLKTEQHAASRQFTTRVPLVAEELGIDGLSASVCKRLYKARSEWVHGAHVRLFSGLGDVDAAEGAGAHTGEQRTVLTDIARLQDVLRAAARKAIEDEEFRAVFTQHDRIRERWPVDLTPPRQPRLARLRRSFTHAAGSVRDSLRRRAR
jgi:hypothetical protein